MKTQDDWQERFPASFISQGILTIEQNGLPLVTRGGSAVVSDNEMVVVFRDGPMIAHYFHFMELLIGCYLLGERYFPSAKIKAFYFGTQAWNNPRQNNVQKNLLTVLYPDAELVDDSRLQQGLEIGNVLVIDRLAGRQLTTINKFLEPFLEIDLRIASKFRDCILSVMKSDDERIGDINRSGPKRAGYFFRAAPRTFSDSAEKELFELLRRSYDIITLDFARMSWVEQVRSVNSLDVAFGVHGNGLTNVCWMKPGAQVIEFFPSGVHHYDYQLLCELFGLNYFGVEGKTTGGFIFRDWSRFGPPYGEHPVVNTCVSELPNARISRLLEL